MKNLRRTLAYIVMIMVLSSAFSAFAAGMVHKGIGAKQVREIAFNDAGASEESLSYIMVQIEQHPDHYEYEVEFLLGQTEYDYQIDGETGKIVGMDRDAEHHAPFGTDTLKDKMFIGEDKAWEIALAHAKVAPENAAFLRYKFELKDGQYRYEVEFRTQTDAYDYEIDAQTGEILLFDIEPENTSSIEVTPSAPVVAADPGRIGEERAIEIALSHAGFIRGEVTELKAELDDDDGLYEYEVEFNVGNMEYSYDINAQTGAILFYEAEKDD